MTHFLKKAALGLALVASATMAAAPAEARDRWGRHRGGGDDAAIAIAAGVAGLAIGAALTSDNRGGYYNDRRYYPRYRTSYYYDSYPRGYYYNRYDRRYRGYDRYERRRWRDHDRHYRWGY